MKTVLAAAVAVSAFAFAGGTSAAAARDLHVMVTPPFATAYAAAGPACAAKAGATLAAAPAADPGGAADTPASRAQRKLPLDVVIQTSAALDQAIGAGLLSADSKTVLAMSWLGIAAKTGAPKLDVGTPEALKRTLLAAKSFGYSAFASGNHLSMVGLPKLGIWDEIKPKGKIIAGASAAAVVRDEVEFGFQQVVELMAVPGVQVARLPDLVQLAIPYGAAVSTTAQAPAEARAFVACLASAETRPALLRVGLEAPPSR